MPLPVLKKSCNRCGKSFFTYESDKEFCTDSCESKYKYFKHFNKIEKLKQHDSVCAYCNEAISTNGLMPRKFCNAKCSREFNNKMYHEKSQNKPKDPKKKPHRLPYEVLNKIAERKRVFDDHDWMYTNNREKI